MHSMVLHSASFLFLHSKKKGGGGQRRVVFCLLFGVVLGSGRCPGCVRWTGSGRTGKKQHGRSHRRHHTTIIVQHRKRHAINAREFPAPSSLPPGFCMAASRGKRVLLMHGGSVSSSGMIWLISFCGGKEIVSSRSSVTGHSILRPFDL